MKTQCNQGHTYDPKVYASCPHCYTKQVHKTNIPQVPNGFYDHPKHYRPSGD